jgi:hypothetical protein
MTRYFFALLLAALAASLIASVAQAQEQRPATPTEAVQHAPIPLRFSTYSILDVAEPVEFSMKNEFGMWLIQKAANAKKTTRLTLEMGRRKVKPGAIIREQVAALLNKAGMVELPPPEVLINPAKAYDVNYDKLTLPGEVLIHIYFDGIGIRSLVTETTYQPFIYAAYCIAIPSKGKGCLAGTSAHYGDWNSANDDLIAVADPLERWLDADDAFAHLEGVDDAFKNGAMKLSPLLAKSILNELQALRGSK